jgi:hypothetical protein
MDIGELEPTITIEPMPKEVPAPIEAPVETPEKVEVPA